MKERDITGKKFNRLTALKYSHTTDRIYWLFKCDCGIEKVIRKRNVMSGNSFSCGCYKKEISKKTPTTHGMSKTRFYAIYKKIQRRCNNKNCFEYKDYGGRGVKNRWKNFEDFKRDMYRSYLMHVKSNSEKNTTINRIDNNGHYYKENCQWTTPKLQARNRRSSRLITYRNKTKTLAEWSEYTGIKSATIARRITKGWKMEDVFNPKTNFRYICIKRNIFKRNLING